MYPRSLNPECTPLKHRYDACFNSWFEGYLRPAADGQQLPVDDAMSLPTSQGSADQRAATVKIAIEKQPRRPLITNWAKAFEQNSSSRSTSNIGARPNSERLTDILNPERADVLLIRTPSGPQSRAQEKAAEYETACGAMWRSYQSCLRVGTQWHRRHESQTQKAISQNESLRSLLESARQEHPLDSQRHLGGGPWDAEANLESDD